MIDEHCKNAMESQSNYDQNVPGGSKLKRFKFYYKVLHYFHLVFMLISAYFFSEVEWHRVYCLYTPGVIVFLHNLQSYEETFAKCKNATGINERAFTQSLNY